ncbi:MAG: hypothetical protein Ta2E_00560 [Mycoplasmoidaceae bacterium]|nr:MAG: hypothetical protein Ta2E_00560 [Mycoplasmoidaceae bacterium]
MCYKILDIIFGSFKMVISRTSDISYYLNIEYKIITLIFTKGILIDDNNITYLMTALYDNIINIGVVFKRIYNSYQ